MSRELQTNDQPEEQKTYPLGQKMGFGAGTLAAAGVLDLFAHLGPTGLVVGGILAYVAAQHGPEMADQLVKSLNLKAESESESSEEPQPARRTGRSFWDRALGRYPEESDQEQPHEAAFDQSHAGDASEAHSTPE